MSEPTLVVLCGGPSAEREVSLGSGRAVAAGLAKSHPVEKVEMEGAALPEWLDPRRHVAFLALHGTFGEDGQVQALLEERGVAYSGCDVAASMLCMDKARTKERVAARGLSVPRGVRFSAGRVPAAAELAGRIGPAIVLKPNGEGSSVGLRFVASPPELEAALSEIAAGEWLAEEKIAGREMTVGLLKGRALGVVEIAPKSGCFDYESKYTKGRTEYFAPAPIPDALAAELRSAAEAAFAVCGCRDYARADFMLSGENRIYFLEINTLPGMKETSLLPMSARCCGLDFPALVSEMIAPAVERFRRGLPLARL